MAKIAVELEQALSLRALTGAPGTTSARVVAEGDGWSVADVICTSGPQDQPFEEEHSEFRIALIAAGSFQYRSAAGTELMTPGSLLLGSAGQTFECSHHHGTGDRCLAFGYSLDYFERIAADAGFKLGSRGLPVHRLPALRTFAPITARAFVGLVNLTQDATDFGWEELSLRFAMSALSLANGAATGAANPAPSALARVTRTVRMIERRSGTPLTLGGLAREARLSPYHFLRTFELLTGMTPHRYLLRTRLREAAVRLAAESAKVIDIALGSGFGDVSNFNRAFRAEFGISPRAYRTQTRKAGSHRPTEGFVPAGSLIVT